MLTNNIKNKIKKEDIIKYYSLEKMISIKTQMRHKKIINIPNFKFLQLIDSHPHPGSRTNRNKIDL